MKRLLCAFSGNWTFPEVVIIGADQKDCGLWRRERIVYISCRFPNSVHVCVVKIKVTDASIFYADNLSLTYVLSRLILFCGVSWKMEPVEDSLSAKKCLGATAGTVQWRCTRSCPSLITRHSLTVSLMYCLSAAFLSVTLSCIYLRNKNASAARVFYIPVLFSNAHRVLSWQCNTPIKLLHLLYDIDFTRHDRE